MGWSGWKADSTGGEVNTKSESRSDGGRNEHVMRTQDNAATGSRDNHSHIVVQHKGDGHKSAHGHGIKR